MTETGTLTAHRRRAPQARAEATRGRLLEVARALFSEQGYEKTSLQAVQARSGVTRGGLFHHFAGKRALFRAVSAQVEGELLAWMKAAASYPGGPWVQLSGACGVLALSLAAPNSRRILLHDAPAVLAGEDLDAERLRLLERFVERAVAGTSTPADRVPAIARFLLGGIRETVVSFGPELTTDEQARFEQTLRLVLDGIRLASKTRDDARAGTPRPARSHSSSARKDPR